MTAVVLHPPECITPVAGPTADAVRLVATSGHVDVQAMAVPVVRADDGVRYRLPAGWVARPDLLCEARGPWARVALPPAWPPVLGHVLALVDGMNPGGAGLVPTAEALAQAVESYLANHTAAALDPVFVPLPDATAPPPDGLVFAFASCQYPAQLFDRALAAASYRRLLARLDPPASAPSLLLLLGDQIYADATAGLLDPQRLAARYDNRHEDARRAMPPQLLARMAVHMQLDDHELADNWEPHCGPDWALCKEEGVRAFRAQRLGGPAQPGSLWGALPTDLHWGTRGVPFFLADSRTERSHRHATNADSAQILSAQQMGALQAWLLRSAADHPGQPLFVAMPAMLLPRHLEVAQDPGAAWRCDGWDGYPASLHALLGFIAHHRIRNVVFLSGDEHLASICQIRLWPDGRPEAAVGVLSVHTPGLYAPFPFSNGRVADFQQDDGFSFDHLAPDGTVQRIGCSLTTEFPENGDGFVVVGVARAADGGWRLTVEIDGAQGVVTRRFACHSGGSGLTSPSSSDPAARP